LDKIKQTKLETAALRGCNLLVNNGLGHWKVKIGNTTNVIARTRHKDKTIEYSRKFIYQSTKEQFDGITLHEATHALLGPDKGHGKEFVDKCIEISPNDKYIGDKANIRLGRYILTCPECGYSGQANTKLNGYCAKCDEKGKMAKFNIEKNIIHVTVW